MPFVQLTNVRLSASALKTARPVAEARRGFDLTLGPGLNGLVGRNGAGKSTLLRFIAGLDTGNLVQGGCTLSHQPGFLRQQVAPQTRLVEITRAQLTYDELRRARAGIPTLGAFEAVDWTLEDRFAAQLTKFGLPPLTLDTPMGALSGGEQMRAALAALFFDAPEIVLLDEPTNNLDDAGREIVFQALHAYAGLALIASHDRDLLGHMDQIVGLEADGTVFVVGGGWSQYVAAQKAKQARVTHQVHETHRALTHAQKAVRAQQIRAQQRAKQGQRLRDGSQAKVILDQAKGKAEAQRGTMIKRGRGRVAAAQDAVTAAQERHEVLTPVRLALPHVPLPSNKHVLDLKAATFHNGTRSIGPVSLSITGPERVRITGENGAGKTTVLRAIARGMCPSTGLLQRHVPCLHLDQMAALSDAPTLWRAAQKYAPQRTEGDLRKDLARAGFRGASVFTPTEALSGGERMRAVFALMSAQSPEATLLLLDEPTNHLDFEAIDALEAALDQWQGALIFVTHDPVFAAGMAATREIAL